MKEKRKDKRFNLSNRPLIYDANSNEFIGSIVDVSAGGFKLCAKEKLTQDQKYLLKIISQSATYDEKAIIAEVNIRWCNENSETNDYYVGCALSEDDCKTRLALASLIIHGFND